MKFSDFFWPDSSLEQIRICYDAAELTIWNRSMNHKVTPGGMPEYALVRRDPLSGYLPAIPM